MPQSYFSSPKHGQRTLLCCCLLFPWGFGEWREQSALTSTSGSLWRVPAVYLVLSTAFIFSISSLWSWCIACNVHSKFSVCPGPPLPVSLVIHMQCPQPLWFQRCVGHLQPPAPGGPAAARALQASSFLSLHITQGQEGQLSWRAQGEAGAEEAPG